MMNPVPWLQMTNMISYQGLVRTFPYSRQKLISPLMAQILQWIVKNELSLHYNLILTMICAG
ncbi:hypothetical protein C6A46_24060 [Escherichia coli]|nr:hypothetical protein C6A46_24060 [Escherichia coli]